MEIDPYHAGASQHASSQELPTRYLTPVAFQQVFSIPTPQSENSAYTSSVQSPAQAPVANEEDEGEASQMSFEYTDTEADMSRTRDSTPVPEATLRGRGIAPMESVRDLGTVEPGAPSTPTRLDARDAHIAFLQKELSGMREAQIQQLAALRNTQEQQLGAFRESHTQQLAVWRDLQTQEIAGLAQLTVSLREGMAAMVQEVSLLRECATRAPPLRELGYRRRTTAVQRTRIPQHPK
ncbi:hypothetical protein C8Q77DRAFT_1160875 [Trametes polyzona]|nr:hypothetical protein C8Q77DRAFT_1160875 [Trametes polyzona]